MFMSTNFSHLGTINQYLAMHITCPTQRQNNALRVGFEPDTSWLQILNTIWKNGPFRNRTNLLYKKTADSVLLGMFMRINAKCNNSRAPSTKRYSAFRPNPIFL